MSKSQVKKCNHKPGEKWTDGCCSSNLAEHSKTEKLEDSMVQGAIKSSCSSELEPQKH